LPDAQSRSFEAHCLNALVSVPPLLELAPNFAELLALSLDEQQELESFASRSANGRPLGDPQFIALVERKLGCTVRRGKPGPKPKHEQR
jgi:putative transposase